jgi:formylglycine-generating enzyme required for sulfatase activity
MQRAGDKVGDYTLERRLGAGNFGEVWLATPLRESLLYPQVALKFAYPGKVKLHEVEREALVWKAASGHENVLAIVDAWVEGDETDRHAIIASEYAPDGTLKDWLGKKREPAEACRMLDGILSGLKHLHMRPQPVIHRDLKPGNVLLNGGVPKLADFGMSRVYQDGGTMIAGGTPQYMAPENFEKQYDAASDVWAAGVLLYRMLAGRLPFPLPPGTPDFLVFTTMSAMLREQPPQPAPEIAAPLWAVLERALAKDPAQRPNAHKLRAALRQAASDAYGVALHRAADPERTVDENEWAQAERAQQQREESARQRREAEQRAAEESAKRQAVEQELARLQAETAVRLQAETQARQRAEAEAARLRAAAQQTPPPAPRVVTPPQPAIVTPRQPAKIVQPRTDTFMLPGGVPLEMVLIPAGKFKMGDKDAGPIHEVTISRPFYLGKYQVTQAQWKVVMNAPDEAKSGLWARLTGNAADNNPSYFKGDNLPVEQVSWKDTQEFCRKLGPEYRLPTEAEWEYACRAGTTGDYAGNLDEMAWYDKNSGDKTHPVGQKKPNPWGLYDMHGNVWEWCQDWYGAYPDQAVTDPSGPTSGSCRVLRGGSWFHEAFSCRSAQRDSFTPDDRSHALGFRLSRTPA